MIDARIKMTALFMLMAASLMLSNMARADFDWGADCSSGEGSFDQNIQRNAVVDVGEIPIGKGNIEILLNSDEDVDIQLIDAITGQEIIAWPNGLLNADDEGCTQYEGLRYCYSGYNGGQTSDSLGHEWIRVDNTSNRRLLMRAYGYAAGQAQVSYRWLATSICDEVGDGRFSQWIPEGGSTLVGLIPAGKIHVEIELEASMGRDLDIQLIDPRDGSELVAWPDGRLHGPEQDKFNLDGMTIVYSGYNGVAGDWGHEKITIEGVVARALQVRAFGYQSGFAEVRYRWGRFAGKMCGGIAGFVCPQGFVCKGMQPGVADAAGSCHSDNWCASNDSAANDCAQVTHIAMPGAWTCNNHYRCHWDIRSCGRPNPNNIYVSDDPNQCASMRFACKPYQEPFSDNCGCGCACPESMDCSAGDCENLEQMRHDCPNMFILE